MKSILKTIVHVQTPTEKIEYLGLLQNLMHMENLYICILKNLRIVSYTRPGRGIRCDEVPIVKVCDLQGASRPRLTHYHRS